MKEAGASAHGNGARQRAIPPRRSTEKRRMEFVKEVCFLLCRTGAKFAGPTPGKGNGKGRTLVQESGLSAKAAGAIRPREARWCAKRFTELSGLSRLRE